MLFLLRLTGKEISSQILPRLTEVNDQGIVPLLDHADDTSAASGTTQGSPIAARVTAQAAAQPYHHQGESQRIFMGLG